MGDEYLFKMPDKNPDAEYGKDQLVGRARVKHANRLQIEFRACALDDLLPADHEARAVWEYVDGLDLSDLYDQIRSVERRAGSPAIDPKILMSLWMYATLKGVGSARELDRLCESHVVYQCICGGVSVNHHTLSDFRTGHGDLLDKLLTQSVATLMHEDLVSLEDVAQDGMRVRANAGTASFRRRKTLERCLEEAEQQVVTLRQELEQEPGAANKRQKAARERAASERWSRCRMSRRRRKRMKKKKPESRPPMRMLG